MAEISEHQQRPSAPPQCPIVLVHGTWARGFFADNSERQDRENLKPERKRWFEEGSEFRQRLEKGLGGETGEYVVRTLLWSGGNSISARDEAALRLAERRVTIQFIFNDRPPSERNFWLIVEPSKEVDLCAVDPGFDADLYVSTDLRTMTEIWIGYTTIGPVSKDGRLALIGDHKLAAELRTWLKLSVFAKIEKKVA